ncbi:OmpW family protein [Temperatibacter marinus]|uniref:OmpW family protein n=1 Tax=Temperatibacter marinus TaxID=1456591 RepID=A0AA52H965_9PROT|nr:OmpW family protein [Temperatibacter marinus]WND02856.1 OmpW family protein [Temperatibacter marinus]
MKTLVKTVSALAILTALLPSATLPLYAEEGDWLVRLRTIKVSPDASATTNIGGSAAIDDATTIELDFTYFITNNIAAELILASTKHHPDAVSTALGDVNLGAVRVLPPTLTLQYHFSPEAKFSPYIGAGLNYTTFFDVEANGKVATDISYSDSFGIALQAGFDFKVSDDWFLNLDVKKIWINTDLKINGGAVTADVDINPTVFGIGIGKKF